LETPVGNPTVDESLRQEILALKSAGNSKFTTMSKRQDENEHSGEMQYPYIAKILSDAQRQNITVTPVMCGSLSTELEIVYGQLLSEIIARPHVLTIISSDFCHWGKRFSYQPFSDGQQNNNYNSMPIHQFIQQMDQKGMDLIQLQKPGAFADYLKETNNTICGRHAIAVWLRAIEATSASSDGSKVSINFVKYAQSSAVESIRDSSVSYAAAVASTSSSSS
jgi:AmmeMemoRadiSam system protein B